MRTTFMRAFMLVGLLALSSGCTHGGTVRASTSSPDRPTVGPSRGASLAQARPVSDDASALPNPACRAIVRNRRLAAPFWLANDHFDPAPAQTTRHTQAEALRAWARKGLKDSQAKAQRPVFAVYNNENGTPTTSTAWIVIQYDVLAWPSIGSHPARVDEVSVIDDASLHLTFTIQAQPTRCR